MCHTQLTAADPRVSLAKRDSRGSVFVIFVTRADPQESFVESDASGSVPVKLDHGRLTELESLVSQLHA